MKKYKHKKNWQGPDKKTCSWYILRKSSKMCHGVVVNTLDFHSGVLKFCKGAYSQNSNISHHLGATLMVSTSEHLIVDSQQNLRQTLTLVTLNGLYH